MLSQRPQLLHLVGGALGLTGVALLLLTGAGQLSPGGVLASLAAMLSSSLGFVLATRWAGQVDLVASTAWQLVTGGALLVLAAVVTGEAFPPLDAGAVLGFGYVSVVATALAFVVWFAGLRALSTGTVGLLGLLNPVTGVLLGVLVAGETLTLRQSAGLALVLIGVALGQPAVARLVGRVSRRAGGSAAVDGGSAPRGAAQASATGRS